MNTNNPDNSDLIEDYLDGRLTSEDKVKLERQLKMDESLKTELNFQKNLKDVWIQSSQFETTKNQLKQILMEKKTPHSTKQILYYAAAACIILLLAIPGYQFLMKSESHQIQTDDLEIKSSLKFYDSRYRQISPVNGQLISDELLIFEWESSLEIKTSLIITNTETGSVVHNAMINSADKKYRLQEYLGKGKYSWRIDGFKGERIFVLK